MSARPVFDHPLDMALPYIARMKRVIASTDWGATGSGAQAFYLLHESGASKLNLMCSWSMAGTRFYAVEDSRGWRRGHLAASGKAVVQPNHALLHWTFICGV